MIIECKGCEKKFSVPDNAIPVSGRLVQCSSCGEKWTQFPVIKKKNETFEKINKLPQKPKKKLNQKKIKKKEAVIYTKEYLKKKHGINLDSPVSNNQNYKIETKKKTGVGFYGFILILIVVLTGLYGILNLTRDIIVYNFPFLENYLNYFYETISNLTIIIQNLLY